MEHNKLPPLPAKSYLGDDASYGYDIEDMRAYAALAVAAERERCAKLCEGVADVCRSSSKGAVRSASVNIATACADFIRQPSSSNGETK